jgi:geranylgeranyl diphosphate synthase, type II
MGHMGEMQPVDFMSSTRLFCAQINDALDRYSQFGEGCPARLQEAIRYSLLAPGKRLRPLLVLMAAEACGSSPKRAMPAACAVEMVHTYSLIHDDLPAMDDDDMRRGRPSCHAAFGEAAAILAGDALLARAFEVLARDLEPPHVAARCCAELAAAAGAEALVGGQSDDLAAEAEAESGNIHRGAEAIPRLEAIHRRKTGAMFLVSLRLGGLAGQASDEQLAHLDEYGRRLGVAFQITDDLLDVEGDEAHMGKRTKKDSTRGKLTYPALLGREESLRRASELIAGARRAIEPLGNRSTSLDALARYVLERNR